MIQLSIGFAMSAIGTSNGVVYQAGGLTSNHDVAIFQTWKNCLPGYVWTHAIIDRYEGLTLFTEDDSTGLHFAHTLCGYGGSGPQAAAQILHDAGFGDYTSLLKLISDETRMQHRITK